MAGRMLKTVSCAFIISGFIACVFMRWISLGPSWPRYPDGSVINGVLSVKGKPSNITQSLVAKETFTLGDVTAVPRDDLVCTPDVRMERRSELCISMDQDDVPLDRIHWATFDNVHKAVWIVVAKAGSRSWLDYFARSVNQTQGINMHRDLYRSLGINFTYRIPLEEFRDAYNDYFKFTVVRHPLQRFVSAYFEIMVKARWQRDKCPSIRRRLSGLLPSASCQDEPILSFQEFAMAIVHGLLPDNEHWRPQFIIVKPCAVDLDIIVKSETGEYDTRLVSNRLGIPGHKVDRIHLGEGHVTEDHASEYDRLIADLTRYDTILFDLQEQHPETFKWVLDYYAIDMEMFGYTWDVESGSGCGYKQHQCC